MDADNSPDFVKSKLRNGLLWSKILRPRLHDVCPQDVFIKGPDAPVQEKNGGCTCWRPVVRNVALFFRIHIYGTIVWLIPTRLPWNINYQANVGDMGPLGYRCVSTLAQYWMVATFAKDTQLFLVKDSKSIRRIHVYKVESLRFTKYRHLSIKAFLLAPLSKWVSKLNLSSSPWWIIVQVGALPGIWKNFAIQNPQIQVG